jgi:hypothetical protein
MAKRKSQAAEEEVEEVYEVERIMDHRGKGVSVL